MTADLRSPFPWFGGKSRVAALVWERFGAVPNYVEPFFGSGAVLLGRPLTHQRDGRWPTETVNDLDCYLANFWRALASDPASAAAAADWPVNEADLHARHNWLLSRAEFRGRMHRDPGYYDVKIAGWWVWGICQWIAGGWCAESCYGDEAQAGEDLGERASRPHLGDAGMGVHRPSQQLPHLGDAGMGVHRPSQKLPHLGDAGRGVHRPSQQLADYFAALADRLHQVRVCCGDWARVLGDSPTIHLGTTGVFLDPPYSAEADRDMGCYGVDSGTVAHEVRAWALANGDRPQLRIALCGYAGEHDELTAAGWECVAWKARGGYGTQADAGRGRTNAGRERIWFSPHCQRSTQGSLL